MRRCVLLFMLALSVTICGCSNNNISYESDSVTQSVDAFDTDIVDVEKLCDDYIKNFTCMVGNRIFSCESDTQFLLSYDSEKNDFVNDVLTCHKDEYEMQLLNLVADLYNDDDVALNFINNCELQDVYIVYKPVEIGKLLDSVKLIEKDNDTFVYNAIGNHSIILKYDYDLGKVVMIDLI